MRKILKWTAALLGLLILALILLLGTWYLRPNQAVVAASLIMDTWDVVNDGEHNSNTDLIDWQGAFYLVHASSPFHFASAESRLRIWRSTDARHWEEVARFDAAGEDIRGSEAGTSGGTRPFPSGRTLDRA